MISSTGTVKTPHAESYLLRLCKHFSKKITIEYGENIASAHFPFGYCRSIAQDQQVLLFYCEAEDLTKLEQLQSVIEHHVGMFTRQNPLVVTWSDRLEIETNDRNITNKL